MSATYAQRTRSLSALLALAAAAFAYVTAEGLPIGLIAPLARDLRVTPADVGLLVTVYGLVVVVASVPLARATARLPRRTVMIAVLALFVVTPIASALAPGYGALLAARVLMALSQALFWAIVVPVAASLYPERHRGRAIATVFAGSSLAGVLGIPLGTVIGQALGWRAAMAMLVVVALPALVVVWLRLPEPRAGRDASNPGPAASVVRYWCLIAVTVLGIGGLYVSLTFYALYVTTVSGFPTAALAPLLLVRGLAGLAGVGIGGALADRAPRIAVILPAAAQAAALAAFWALGGDPAVVVAASVVSGVAFTALTTALGTRVLQVAPRDVDMSAAGLSAGVNVGIVLGSLTGSLLIDALGVVAIVGVGAAMAAASVMFAVAELRRAAAPAARAGRAPR
jgi:MFS transporter, DHA1 family, inner membrane transport protein